MQNILAIVSMEELNLPCVLQEGGAMSSSFKSRKRSKVRRSECARALHGTEVG